MTKSELFGLTLVRRRIMWWAINQICCGCDHKKYLEKKEMDELIAMADGEDEELLYHASRCGRGIVLGMLGTGSYDCEHCTYKD